MSQKILSIILILTIFTGCQSGLSVFDKTGTAYEKGLQHTKVKPLIFEKDTKAIINITYLNTLNPTKWDNENQNFLIGIYIPKNDNTKNKQFLQNFEYKLTMNDSEYTASRLILDDETQYSIIPLKNPWAQYYIISFKDIDTKTLSLKYSHLQFGEVNLEFEKE